MPWKEVSLMSQRMEFYRSLRPGGSFYSDSQK